MIFFLHIPKTAGTTFYDVVDTNHAKLLKPKIDENPLNYFNNNLILNNCAIRLPGGYESAPQTLKIIENLSTIILKKITFIGGHVGYGFHENFPEKIQYISFIRNPRERLISDYKEHCKKGRFFYDILLKNDFQFNAYLKAVKDNNLDNILTRQLAGPFDFFLKQRRAVDNELLEIATQNCKSVVFFEMKDFNNTLLYLKYQFGWKKTSFQIKNQSNSTNMDFEIDEDLLNEIINYDLKLYASIKPLIFKRKSLLQKLFRDK